MLEDEWLPFIPCLLVVGECVLVLSVLDRLELPGRRVCDEDGLSRGDFGGGMPSPLDTLRHSLCHNNHTRWSSSLVAINMSSLRSFIRVDLARWWLLILRRRYGGVEGNDVVERVFRGSTTNRVWTLFDLDLQSHILVGRDFESRAVLLGRESVAEM